MASFSSSISRLLNQLYPFKVDEYRVLILGNDASGFFHSFLSLIINNNNNNK